MAEQILILGGWSFQGSELDSLQQKLPQHSEVRTIDPEELAPTPFKPDASYIERLSDVLTDQTWDLVIGWSMGSMMAVESVLSDKLQAKSLLLFAPCPSFVQTDFYPEGWTPEDVDTLASGVEQDLERTMRIFRRRCGSQEWKAGSSSKLKDALLDGLDYVKTYDETDRLKNLNVPLTLIHGQSDKIIHPSASEKIHQKVPTSSLIRVPGGSHSLCLNEDNPISEWIESALQRGK